MLRLKKLIKDLVGLQLDGTQPQYAPRKLRVPDYYHREDQESPTPTISIVTPSFNQGRFLERTMESIVSQGYEQLQYIVQDGNSTDETREVLQRFSEHLHHWEMAPDNGQASAINKGFAHSTGEIMAFVNSDDLLLPGALQHVAREFSRRPDVDVIYGHRVIIDEEDRDVGRWVLPPHRRNVFPWVDFLPQETMFWRRRIWEKVGAGLDESLQFALDWDLLLRFREAGATFLRTPRFLGCFRIHAAQKTEAWKKDVGEPECNLLRQRTHGRSVRRTELILRVLPYVVEHLWYSNLHRFNIARF